MFKNYLDNGGCGKPFLLVLRISGTLWQSGRSVQHDVDATFFNLEHCKSRSKCLKEDSTVWNSLLEPFMVSLKSVSIKILFILFDAVQRKKSAGQSKYRGIGF